QLVQREAVHVQGREKSNLLQLLDRQLLVAVAQRERGRGLDLAARHGNPLAPHPDRCVPARGPSRRGGGRYIYAHLWVSPPPLCKGAARRCQRAVAADVLRSRLPRSL